MTTLEIIVGTTNLIKNSEQTNYFPWKRWAAQKPFEKFLEAAAGAIYFKLIEFIEWEQNPKEFRRINNAAYRDVFNGSERVQTLFEPRNSQEVEEIAKRLSEEFYEESKIENKS